MERADSELSASNVDQSVDANSKKWHMPFVVLSLTKLNAKPHVKVSRCKDATGQKEVCEMQMSGRDGEVQFYGDSDVTVMQNEQLSKLTMADSQESPTSEHHSPLLLSQL